MSAIDDILGKLPIGELAAQLGSDTDSVRVAASDAIASVMGGLRQNSSEPIGQSSLATALKDHSASQLLATGTAIDLHQIDQADGAKIVRHALGSDPTQVVRAMGGRGDESLIQRLLPIIAPLVLAYLASRLGNPQIEAGRKGHQEGGSVLDAIVGRGGQLGANPSQEYQRGYRDGYDAAREEGQQQGGLNLGDLIGGMMGGHPRQQGGIGGLLGELFG